jgi:hypothetical protein
MDFDGQFEYSKVIMVNSGRHALVKVYPNPAKEKLNILTEETVKKIDIYSITGVKVFSTSPARGVWQEINVQLLDPGQYIVQVSTDSESLTRHFIKK